MDDDERVKWRLPNTEIVIAKVDSGPRTGEWLFTAATVELLGLLLGVGVYRLGRRADKRCGSKSQSGDRPSRRGTILALVFAVAVAIGVETVIDDIVNFTGGMLVLSSRLFVILTYALVGWVAVLLLTQIPEVIIRSRRLRPRCVDSQLLRLGFKLLALITIAALIIDGADKLALPAYSVITGVGGLAVALAARETIANLPGSLAIMLDRPFRIGDRIRIGDDEGTVEGIGFRMTRIQTFYDSLLSIPNATTVNAAIDNMGQRQFPGHPPTAVDPPAAEALAAVAKSFGPGGSAARPRGLGLFTPPTEER